MAAVVCTACAPQPSTSRAWSPCHPRTWLPGARSPVPRLPRTATSSISRCGACWTCSPLGSFHVTSCLLVPTCRRFVVARYELALLLPYLCLSYAVFEPRMPVCHHLLRPCGGFLCIQPGLTLLSFDVCVPQVVYATHGCAAPAPCVGIVPHGSSCCQWIACLCIHCQRSR